MPFFAFFGSDALTVRKLNSVFESKTYWVIAESLIEYEVKVLKKSSWKCETIKKFTSIINFSNSNLAWKRRVYLSVSGPVLNDFEPPFSSGGDKILKLLTSKACLRNHPDPVIKLVGVNKFLNRSIIQSFM